MNYYEKSLLSIAIFAILTIIICNCELHAQIPQYYNNNTTQAPNKFPFNEPTGKRIQSIYLPGEFIYPLQPPPGNIVRLSYRMVLALGPYTYSDFTIKMGQSNITELPNATWYTGQLDTVYHRNSVTFSALAGDWMAIDLDSSFAFNPAQSLIIEVQQCGAPGASGFSTSTGVVIGNRRSVSSGGAVCPFNTVGITDGIILTIGITYGPPTGISGNANELPYKFQLMQNYPNPFNPTTQIGFSLASSGNVILTAFDAMGRKVATLVDGYMEAGRHNAEFDGSDLSSGIYYYKITAGDFNEVKKMTLLK